MKNTQILRAIASLLILATFATVAIGCKKPSKNDGNGNTNDITNPGENTTPDDDQKVDDGGDNNPGEDNSDNGHISEVEGVKKSINLTSGDSREITISDYVSVSGAENLTYEVKSNSDLLSCGSVAYGKFTITAASVSELTNATITITVSSDGEVRLTVQLFVTIIEVGGYVPDDNVDTDW